jgi:integrase
MLLFKGTVGCRIDELFTLTDDRVDLVAGEIFIPADLCKEAVDKWIALTAEEENLLREQLLARAAGTRYVFPTKTGLTWHGRYGSFHRLVWAKATRRAAERWREVQGVEEAAPTPFDELEPHDLRATAATLMRDAGFTREEAAARLGHADSGKLLDRVYDVGDRRARMRKAIALRAPAGLRATLSEHSPRRSDSPAAAGLVTEPSSRPSGNPAAAGLDLRGER